MGNKQATTS